MVDILLIYPPYSYPRKSPPLGLAYIASVLEKANYSVKILDMSPLRIELEDLQREIMHIKPKVVGISFMTNQYGVAIKVSKLVKAIDSKIPVIVGGPHATALPCEMLENGGVDFVVIGEGEVTICELASELLKGGNNFESIAGIAYKKDGKLMVTERREFIKNLDSVPFPAWHLLPIDRYSVIREGGDIREKVLPILDSRGCPYQCIFCDSHTVLGRRFRSRSARNIFEEIVYLKARYNLTQFDFVDDTLTIDRKKLIELCNLLLQENLRINWMCNARVDTVDLEMLDLMEKAGCVRIDLGVESGDKDVLKAIKKGTTLDQIKIAHNLVHQAGIKINTFVMVGNLGEDFSSVKKTVKLMEDIPHDDCNVSIATPFPGTELYRIAQENGWLRVTDWSRYVTAPTYLPGYRPIMITDKMGEDDVLKAFFYVHSNFIKEKLEFRYGKRFYFNPRFYAGDLLRVRSWRDLIHKGELAWALISSIFKGK